MTLALRSALDPVSFASPFFVAGYRELRDQNTGFGWGAEGLGKRAGAAYLDNFDGKLIGKGILPSLLHQDPRYFRLGHGSALHRGMYALATGAFVCKNDKDRNWQPNYSTISGNLIAGALSNLYYPSNNSGMGESLGNGMMVTVQGTLGSVFQEFWPDISRKFLHRDPTHGLDAQKE